MNRLLVWPLSLTLTAVALAGCAGTSSAPPSSAAQPSATTAARSTAGMVMPVATGSPAPGRPTATAALICGDEIKGKVQEVLKLPKPPAATSTFAANLFTCTYRLAQGPMRLSVQHSATKTAALAYLKARRATVKATESTPGLGERAYSTGTGVVLVIKDNETLEVDTTGLPAVLGDEGQKRTDLAYEIASDVLGCWTGDDDS
jgi:hypothetical protein